jgi:hypothetical protein
MSRANASRTNVHAGRTAKCTALITAVTRLNLETVRKAVATGLRRGRGRCGNCEGGSRRSGFAQNVVRNRTRRSGPSLRPGLSGDLAVGLR